MRFFHRAALHWNCDFPQNSNGTPIEWAYRHAYRSYRRYIDMKTAHQMNRKAKQNAHKSTLNHLTIFKLSSRFCSWLAPFIHVETPLKRHAFQLKPDSSNKILRWTAIITSTVCALHLNGLHFDINIDARLFLSRLRDRLSHVSPHLESSSFTLFDATSKSI